MCEAIHINLWYRKRRKAGSGENCQSLNLASLLTSCTVRGKNHILSGSQFPHSSDMGITILIFYRFSWGLYGLVHINLLGIAPGDSKCSVNASYYYGNSSHQVYISCSVSMSTCMSSSFSVHKHWKFKIKMLRSQKDIVWTELCIWMPVRIVGCYEPHWI